ncbi:MAG: hypothetical protein VYD61_07985 [SAR324 cluster bacterium]|nr:hypothetical protein [SAR324 cluster bacterium]
MLSSGLGKYIAPTSLGAGYAITKMLSLRVLDPELAIAQDFTYQFLAGILLGFALRPVTNQIYWKRTTSILFVSMFLLILGPGGQMLRQRIWGIPFDDTFWRLLFAEIITAFVVSILATILLPAKQQTISPGLLLRRIKKELSISGLLKLFGCGLLYALLFLIFQSIFDESFAAPFWMGRLEELLSLPPVSTQEKILLLWVQGLLNALILLPLFLVFLREKVELIVVFGSLSFIVAVFSPAFANFQRIEPLLLVDQVFIGFCLHFIFVSGTVFCFGRNIN